MPDPDRINRRVNSLLKMLPELQSKAVEAGHVVMFDPDDRDSIERPDGHRGTIIFLPHNGREDQTAD